VALIGGLGVLLAAGLFDSRPTPEASISIPPPRPIPPAVVTTASAAPSEAVAPAVEPSALPSASTPAVAVVPGGVTPTLGRTIRELSADRLGERPGTRREPPDRAPRPAVTAPRAEATPSSTVPAPAPVAAPPHADPPTVAEPTGRLQVLVRPWAEVSVDGVEQGTTPFRPITLPVGMHTVLISHPEFKPFQRKVTIRPNELSRLEVDLSWEAFRR
jgi:serine/threonine-protein kinase